MVWRPIQGELMTLIRLTPGKPAIITGHMSPITRGRIFLNLNVDSIYLCFNTSNRVKTVNCFRCYKRYTLFNFVNGYLIFFSS